MSLYAIYNFLFFFIFFLVRHASQMFPSSHRDDIVLQVMHHSDSRMLIWKSSEHQFCVKSTHDYSSTLLKSSNVEADGLFWMYSMMCKALNQTCFFVLLKDTMIQSFMKIMLILAFGKIVFLEKKIISKPCPY